jgi:hypothetical protein
MLTLMETEKEKGATKNVKPIVAGLAQTVHVFLNSKDIGWIVAFGRDSKNKSVFLNTKACWNADKYITVGWSLSKSIKLVYLTALKVCKKTED